LCAGCVEPKNHIWHNNREHWSEPGPYGSVRADTPPESIPQSPGCIQNSTQIFTDLNSLQNSTLNSGASGYGPSKLRGVGVWPLLFMAASA